MLSQVEANSLMHMAFCVDSFVQLFFMSRDGLTLFVLCNYLDETIEEVMIVAFEINCTSG